MRPNTCKNAPPPHIRRFRGPCLSNVFSTRGPFLEKKKSQVMKSTRLETDHRHHKENLQGGNPRIRARGVLVERIGFVVLLEHTGTYPGSIH